MSSEWKEVCLGDLVENKSRRFNFDDKEEVVFINTGDVLEGNFLHGNLISKVGLPGQAKKRIEKNDILFSEIRPANGRYALVDFDAPDYVVSTKFMVLSRITEEVDLKFLYQLITCKPTLKQFQLIAESRSGTFPQITFDTISHLPFNLPPLQEQKAIAHILGTLDDKIELNRKMNETLEEMAQAMFKSWFVDFDPVMDNALASGNEIPEALKAKAEKRKEVLESGKYKKLPQDIMDLFPSSFVWNDELGKWIPEGWENSTIGETSILKNGFAFKGKDFVEEGVPVIKIKNVKPNKILYDTLSFVSDEVAKKAEKYRIKKGDILITMTGNRYGGGKDSWVGKVAMFDKQGHYLLNQRVAIISPDLSIVSKNFLNLFMASEEMQLYLVMNSTSSGGQANISPSTVANISIALPNKKIFEEFDKVMESFNKTINLNIANSDALKASRDTLLPKLISGKLRLSEALSDIE